MAEEKTQKREAKTENTGTKDSENDEAKESENTKYKDTITEDYIVQRDNDRFSRPIFGIHSEKIGKSTYPTIDERFVK